MLGTTGAGNKALMTEQALHESTVCTSPEHAGQVQVPHISSYWHQQLKQLLLQPEQQQSQGDLVCFLQTAQTSLDKDNKTMKTTKGNKKNSKTNMQDLLSNWTGGTHPTLTELFQNNLTSLTAPQSIVALTVLQACEMDHAHYNGWISVKWITEI